MSPSFSAWRVSVVFTAANLTGGAFRSIVASAGTAEKAVAGNEAALKRMRAIAIGTFATVGVVGVAAFLHAADAAGKYQLQMSLLQQQLGATDGQMEKIGRRIISLSSGPTRTMFGMSDLSIMARSIQQSGLGADAVESLLTPIAYAAEIEKLRKGHLDPATFTANISATIKGLGLGAPGREADAMKFAREFTGYASVSKLDSAGLLAYENQFGLISREAGWKADDFLTAGAFFSQMGVKPQMIGTMMKNILTNLTPRATLTGHAETAQFMGLMNMGMLTHADPVAAKKYLAFVQQNEKSLGLPSVDPSKMTAAQQEVLGGALLRGSVSSAAMGQGLDGLATLLHNAYLAYQTKFGNKEGEARFARDARNVFNLRGLPAALALAQAGPAGVADVRGQYLKQVPLDARAAMLRGEYEPMKEMLGGMITSVMVTLGGVTAGGKVTPGGPLDIMTKVLQQTEALIGQFVAWSAANPKLIAQIGTLMGAAGVLGLIGAFALVVTAIAPTVVTLATFIGSIGGVALALGAPLLLLPALAAGIYLFATHLGSIQHYLGKIGTWISTQGGPMLGNAIHNAWVNALKYIVSGYNPAPRGSLKPLPDSTGGKVNWFAPVKGSFLAGLFPGWTEAKGQNWQTTSWQSPAMRNTPGNDGRGPQAVAFEVNFNGITDTGKMVKAMEDWVNKWLNFEGNRRGGSPAHPRVVAPGGW